MQMMVPRNSVTRETWHRAANNWRAWTSKVLLRAQRFQSAVRVGVLAAPQQARRTNDGELGQRNADRGS